MKPNLLYVKQTEKTTYVRLPDGEVHLFKNHITNNLSFDYNGTTVTFDDNFNAWDFNKKYDEDIVLGIAPDNDYALSVYNKPHVYGVTAGTAILFNQEIQGLHVLVINSRNKHPKAKPYYDRIVSEVFNGEKPPF